MMAGGWFSAAAAIALAAPIAAQQADSARPKDPWKKTLVLISGYGWHRDGPGNGQLAMLTAAREKETWTFNVGRRSLINEDGFGIGTGYMRRVSKGIRLGIGAGTGANVDGNLYPRYSITAQMRAVLAPGVLSDLGYTRYQPPQREAHADRFGAGLTLYRTWPWVLEGNVSYSLGSPGRTRSWGGGGGVTYAIWQRWYFSAHAGYGDGRYVDLGTRQLIEFQGWSYRGRIQKYLSPTLTTSVSYGHSDYYGGGSLEVGLSKEW